jgi:hypothetical protein
VGHIQIKNVPADLHDRIRARARAGRQTVRDYLLTLAERDLSRPTLDEWLDELKSDPPIDLPPGAAAAAVREAREEREQQLADVFERNHPRS